MHFDYEPGLYGLSDFSGKTLGLRTGRGEKDVEIFVAVLAHSSLTYAEAVILTVRKPARNSSIIVSSSRTAPSLSARSTRRCCASLMSLSKMIGSRVVNTALTSS